MAIGSESAGEQSATPLVGLSDSERELTRLSLLVVVVNYRTPAMTCDCLRSLSQELADWNDARLVVVDNASGDGSAEQLRRAIEQAGWQQWAQVLEAASNLGFAGGNNFAIRRSPPARHILLLNSDTVVRAGCLHYCYREMEANPDIGAMSCLLIGADGEPQTQARRFPAPWRELSSMTGLPWRLPGVFGHAATEDSAWDRRRECRDVDWLGGAFLWLKQDALDQIGLLDESFFFYGEDIELCHRLARAGWRRRYDPSVSIVHYGGGSEGGSNTIHEKTAYWQARYLVQRRCYGVLASYTLRLTDAAIWRLRKLKLRWRGQTCNKAYGRAATICRLLWRPMK